MRRRAGRGFVVAVVALAAACSSPSLSEQGFISLGRDVGLDGGSIAGRVPTGGTGGAGVIGGTGFVGMGGTLIPQGGSAGDANGGTNTSGQGGTTGVNGGTSTGGDGSTCGSGGMPPVLPPNAGGAELTEACREAGADNRICLSDDNVVHCGVTPTVLEQCPPGTCSTGCCHASSDPCPLEGAGFHDCEGDCYGSCTGSPIISVTMAEDDLQIIRIGGSHAREGECGRYFEILVNGPGPGTLARITVSPPWRLNRGCPGPEDGQCLVTDQVPNLIVVSTNVDAPPPRNVVVETSRNLDLCPLL